MKFERFGMVAAVMIGLGSIASADAATVELLPSLDNPKLHFDTGRVVHNMPEVSPVLPNLPGEASPWHVSQWTQPEVMSGDKMAEHDPATADPALGTAAYSFDVPDQHSHVWIYTNGPGGHLVYDLFERGGTLTKGGGSNIFLSTHPLMPVTLDHTINFSVQAKVSRAVISYDTPSAKRSGAVLAQSFTGFVLQFPSPVGGKTATMFLQVPIANSPNKTRIHISCHFNNGALQLIGGGTLSGQPPLLFQAGASGFTTISYSLSDYVSQMFSQPIACGMKGGGQQMVSLQSVAPSTITLKNLYIGLETEDTDHRKSSHIAGPQGNVEFGLQLSDLHLTEND